MDSASLAAMLADVEQQHINLHSLLVIRHGFVVSETYYPPYTAQTRHELYSVTKSFTATLIGIAIDQGKLSLEDRVLDLLGKRTFSNVDERKQAMTVAHLLSMASGLQWVEGDPTYQAMYYSKDWVKYVLDAPMLADPGSQFVYCSGCSHVLSAIVAVASGMNALQYAQQYLFAPIGITGEQWDLDSQDIPIGGWGLNLTPRAMARLGYLYLHAGRWQNQQVVSAEWVKAATEMKMESDGLGYGYQWWIDPDLGGYAALGRYGQTIYVLPRLDLVIVFTAQVDDHDDEFRLIREYIVPAVSK